MKFNTKETTNNKHIQSSHDGNSIKLPMSTYTRKYNVSFGNYFISNQDNNSYLSSQTHNESLRFRNENNSNVSSLKKLASINSSISTEATTSNRFKVKIGFKDNKMPINTFIPGPGKSHANPQIVNKNTYRDRLCDNKLLKNKIPKINNIISPMLPKYKNDIKMKNSKLVSIIIYEDKINQSRIEKSKFIEKKFENLYKKKTFSTDHKQKKIVQEAIEKMTIEREMEVCTFRPIIHRKAMSAVVSAKHSPLMTTYNSRSNISFGATSANMYDKQVDWQSKVKSRNTKNKTTLMFKETLACSFKPQLSRDPDFEFRDKNRSVTIQQNVKYYERIKKAKLTKFEGMIKSFPNYSSRFDERKRKFKTICQSENE